MSGLQPRLAALDLLGIILNQRRTLDEALTLSHRFVPLKGPDRGLARAIVSAVLRQAGRIDAALEPFLNRPLETASPDIQALLRIGAAQAWVMDMPDHAVVSTTVAAAKQLPGARRAAGFINAVLRKVVAHKDGFDTLPATQIWPVWLRTIFVQNLGAPAANRLAELQIAPPDIHLTPKSGSADKLAQQVGGTVLAGQSVQVPSGAVDTYPGFAEGDWWVQDVAAALPARVLHARPGETVLDLCAAPGGKTLQLAASGAQLIAVDRSRKRLERVHENLARTQLAGHVDVRLGDVENLSLTGPADKILLDAPCSALGTLRRHPEGAWIKKPADIARFPDIQTRLLRAALGHLKPGGQLVYCVCTPLPAEGTEVVRAVLAEDPHLRRLPIEPGEVQGFEGACTRSGDVLTLPGAGFAHDAFFIARLTKTA